MSAVSRILGSGLFTCLVAVNTAFCGNPDWTLVADQTVISTPSEELTRSLRRVIVNDDETLMYANFIQKSDGAGVREYSLSGDPPTATATAFFNVTDVSPSGNLHQPEGLDVDDRDLVYVGSSKDSTSGDNARVIILPAGLGSSQVFALLDIDFPGFTGETIGDLRVRNDGGTYQLYVSRLHSGSAYVERYIIGGSTVGSMTLTLDASFNGTGRYSLITDGGFAGAGFLRGIDVAVDGTIFVVSREGNLLYRISSDLTTVATVGLSNPMGVVLYDGRAFVTQYNGNTSSIAEVDQSTLSVISTFDAFDDFPRDPGSDGNVAGYAGIDVDTGGHIYLGDQLYFRTSAESRDRVLRSSSVNPPDPGLLSIETPGSCQDDWDANAGNGKQVAFELWMRDLPQNVTGFQAFLLYDNAKLTFNDTLSSYTNAPFPLHVTPIAMADMGGGSLSLDGSDNFNGGGTDQDSLLVTLVFDVNSECMTTDVVFDTSLLFDSELSFEGALVPTDLSDSPEIFLDDTAPVITCPPDVTVNCPEEAIPAIPFGSTSGGVAIYYNAAGGEVPTNQAFLKSQCSNVYDPAANGAPFTFSTAVLDGYGTTWALVFNDLGQYGFDLVFETPFSDNSVATPGLTAVDYDGAPCTFTPAGLVSWAVNDYKCASPNGPCNPSTQPVNSPLRSETPPDYNPFTGHIQITRNDLMQMGSDFQSYIEGRLLSDGAIHWFNPAEGSTPLAALGLPSDFYFHGTLDYDFSSDTTPGMDFYEGDMTITLGGPTTLTGYATAADNCLQPVAMSFSDVVNGSGCTYTITRTWTATDQCGNSSSCVQTITVDDTTEPKLLTACPDDIEVNSTAGGCNAFVDWDDAAASDNCDGNSSTITYEIDLDDDSSVDAVIAASSYTFPAGTHRVTVVAADPCGNENTDCSFLVTVNDVTEVDVEIELASTFIPVTRCIHFVLDDCGATADIELSFIDHDASSSTPVRFSGLVELPCGNWLNLCAKDEQHTKWDSSSLSLGGGIYIADTLITLLPGDTDNDGDVDIHDVTLLIDRFGLADPPAGCPWNGMRGADFSNNGNVGSEDYSALSGQWLTVSSCACFSPLVGGNDQKDFGRFAVSVLASRLDPAIARKTDLNHDGIVDYRDVRIFEDRNGLGNTLSNQIETIAKSRR